MSQIGQQTATETRFAEATKLLYHQTNTSSTTAIRSLDRLAAALADVETSFSPTCETSKQLISDAIMVLNPYSPNYAPSMAVAFKTTAREYKHQRGIRYLKANPPPTTPLAKPLLRRTVSS